MKIRGGNRDFDIWECNLLLKHFFFLRLLITQYMLINECSMTTDCGTKTCNEHSTSEYDLHKCNFKNSSDWTVQIKAFELLSDTHTKKTVEEVGGSDLLLQQHPFSYF